MAWYCDMKLVLRQLTSLDYGMSRSLGIQEMILLMLQLPVFRFAIFGRHLELLGGDGMRILVLQTIQMVSCQQWPS